MSKISRAKPILFDRFYHGIILEDLWGSIIICLTIDALTCFVLKYMNGDEIGILEGCVYDV